MKKTSILLHFVLLMASYIRIHATHIAGGDITYKYLGNNNYEITVRIYFDCFNGSASAISSDMSISVGFFDMNNNQIASTFISGVGPDTITNVNYPCIIPPSNFCIMKYVYVTTVNIPAPPGGFKAVFQRCCRNNVILNIVDPGNTGATFFTDVADISVVTTNSSPIFNYDPPVYLCLNKPVAHNFSATDPDGDSLLYELFTPFDGASAAVPQPQPPNQPPYFPINWSGGYNVNNMLGTNPPMTIDPQSGILTVTPTTLGVFVVGVVVKEYRGGIYIGETKRDYQFNVINCQFSAVAAFTTPQINCSKWVQFQNNSQSANQFLWDFGVPGVNTDTSSQFQPAFLYPDFGSYTVTLIASDTICSDSVTSTVQLFPKPEIFPTLDTILCGPDTVSLVALIGSSWPPTIPVQFTWSASPSGAAQISNPSGANASAFVTQNVTITVSASVSNSQCDTSVSRNIQVYPVPEASFAYEEFPGCLDSKVHFYNNSTDAQSISWRFTPGGNFSESDPKVTFDLGSSVLVELTAVNGPCTDKDTMTIFLQGQKPIKEPVPNIITPYTIDNLNDCFDISSSADGSQCFDLWIFNRWGQLVYDSKLDGHCWNGKVRNKNALVTPGVYFYLVYVNGAKKEFGTVTVASGE